MAGPQLKRTQKSRARNGKRIEVRELIKSIPTTNVKEIVAETEKGTSFKGEMRRKCLNEIARREKLERALIVEHSKAGQKTKPQTNNNEETTNG